MSGLFPTSLAALAAVTGGRLVGPDATVLGLATDSRTVGPGEVFVAVPGERTDGHDHARGALAAGAAGVLAARPVPEPYLLVPDTLVALAAVAAAHRAALEVRVVGVTGSAGKTTTKDLLAHVLGTAGPTVAPPGSYNNDLGLPLTVLRAQDTTRFLVLEMGARARGDVARLCAIGQPQVGVVLNVGSAHLGEFGSREAIAAAKGELVEGASERAVLNADDALVAAMAARARAEVRTFGLAAGDVRAEGVRLDDGGRAAFALVGDHGRESVRLRLVGAHQVPNALAAATVAIGEGMDAAAVAAALGTAQPASRWRMEVRTRADGLVVVNDAYNANPESVRSAVDATAALARGRRVWAVLGSMLELGPTSDVAHEEIGRYAVTHGVDRVVAVGSEPLARGAGAAATAVADAAAALALVAAQAGAGDVVLVKASRGIGLERVAIGLLDNAPMVTGRPAERRP